MATQYRRQLVGAAGEPVDRRCLMDGMASLLMVAGSATRWNEGWDEGGCGQWTGEGEGAVGIYGRASRV